MPHSRMRWMIVLVLMAILAASCGSAAAPAGAPTVAAPATATLAAAATSAPTATNVPPTVTVATAAPVATTPAPTPAASAITLTDSLSRTVTLAAPARRVVSLAPSNTEILYAIGAGAVLAGRDDYSDYPAAATAVPSIGNEIPLNIEAIVALHPDLVLAAGITSADDVAQLAKLGLTVYATSNAGSLDDIYHDIHAIGVLVGQVEAADQLAASMQARVDAVKTKMAAVTQHAIVFYEIDATDPSKPWTAGPGSFIDQLITLAGGNNAGSGLGDKYAQISLEQLVTRNPDIIVLGSSTLGGQTPALVAARPGWGTIKAVKNHAVYAFDDNLVSRPGPRVVDGLEKLAALIHPDLFK